MTTSATELDEIRRALDQQAADATDRDQRVTQQLETINCTIVKLLTRLADTTWRKPESGLEAIQDIEFFCDCVAGELRRQKLSDVQGNWLWTLGPDVQERIADPELRALNVMED